MKYRIVEEFEEITLPDGTRSRGFSRYFVECCDFWNFLSGKRWQRYTNCGPLVGFDDFETAKACLTQHLSVLKTKKRKVRIEKYRI